MLDARLTYYRYDFDAPDGGVFTTIVNVPVALRGVAEIEEAAWLTATAAFRKRYPKHAPTLVMTRELYPDEVEDAR